MIYNTLHPLSLIFNNITMFKLNVSLSSFRYHLKVLLIYRNKVLLTLVSELQAYSDINSFDGPFRSTLTEPRLEVGV